MKIAINRCFGGFSVNNAVMKELGFSYAESYSDDESDSLESNHLYNEMFGIKYNCNINAYRADPRLIAAIEKIGEEKAGGCFSSIEIIEIPDYMDWRIGNYDGQEYVEIIT